MRLVPSDPDLESLVRRINDGELNLQPDFQRGEIWSLSKKQKLIDSILRDWYVPPIHLIVDRDGGSEEVLDGQQRLAAIRDFAANEIRIDSYIDPIDPKLQPLHGLTYQQLPLESRKAFDRFSIRTFRLYDYEPEEPYELFFRLNQSVILTAAEQRNTFFGKARDQVRELVNQLGGKGLNPGNIGFSNSRMAYDDILVRLCLVLEVGSNVKISGSLLTDVYRVGDGFPNNIIKRAENTIEIFSQAVLQLIEPVKFNKATFFSWLYFVAQLIEYDFHIEPLPIRNYIERFERIRRHAKGSFPEDLFDTSKSSRNTLQIISEFNDRATSRVWDASSVVIRDSALWLILLTEGKSVGIWPENAPKFSFLLDGFDPSENLSGREMLHRVITSEQWGGK